MTASVGIAALALLVSILSLIISKRSFDRTGRVHDQQQRDTSAQKKRELLVLMSDCRAELNNTRVNIGALKVVFESEPEAVRALLVNYVGLFDQYLPMIEKALVSVDNDRQAVSDWNEDISVVDLERQFARIYDDLKSFEFASSQADKMIATFSEKLELARTVSHTGS